MFLGNWIPGYISYYNYIFFLALRNEIILIIASAEFSSYRQKQNYILGLVSTNCGSAYSVRTWLEPQTVHEICAESFSVTAAESTA